MNKSIILVILPCIVAFAVVQGMGYSYGSYGNMYGNMGYYQGQLQAHQAQTGYYNYGNQATAALRTSRLLNYLFGFLLLLDLTNATGNTIG